MQCDLHDNDTESRRYAPYLLDVQADQRRDVWPQSRPLASDIRRFGQAGGDATHLIAAIPRHILGASIGSRANRRYTIISAIDVLLAGV